MSSHNPFSGPEYQTPKYNSTGEGPSEEQLAGRFTRFAAVMIDGILLAGILLPIQYYSGFLDRAQLNDISIVDQLTMSGISICVMLLVNGHLLANHGQTVGKMLTGIQIVDVESGSLIPFARLYPLRYLWLLPLNILAMFIPQQTGTALVVAASLIDSVLIFGPSRRCLHDYIAGTRVVRFHEGRPKTVS